MQHTGIDYIFSSPGSEWPPVWEALAEQTAQGIKKPGYINCRHEAVAVAMAAGYIKTTNRPQVVMLHATAGPLNAAMTLRAALHERTSMVILTGEIAAYGENAKVADPGGQWLHDLTDLGGSPDLLRSCAKVGGPHRIGGVVGSHCRARRPHRRGAARGTGSHRRSV
jgi:acetolactate synthase I/II/III large subunit